MSWNTTPTTMYDITPAQYQKLAQRTECDQMAASRRRLYIDNEVHYAGRDIDGGLLATRLNHAVIGLAGEVGELAGALEGVVHYGKTIDYTNIKEELGDCLWYLALACNALGFGLSDVMESNIRKLQARYPDKFNAELCQEENRRRDIEREVIEGGGYASSEVVVNCPPIKTLAGNPIASDPIAAQSLDSSLPPTTIDYPERCIICGIAPVHKTNTTKTCPDCYQSNVSSD